jgi:hypothetical protein
VYVSVPYPPDPLKPLRVFQSLKTLPNLTIITFNEYSAPLQPQELHNIVTIAQKTALREVHFSLVYGSVVTGPPIAGPQGLESISVQWNVHDDPNDPGSSMTHLTEFLRPSFCTLTCLTLRDYGPKVDLGNPQFLDFRGLGSICHSLRSLEYLTCRSLIELIQEVSEVFPNLTYLKVVCKKYMQRWTVCQTATCSVERY